MTGDRYYALIVHSFFLFARHPFNRANHSTVYRFLKFYSWMAEPRRLTLPINRFVSQTCWKLKLKRWFNWLLLLAGINRADGNPFTHFYFNRFNDERWCRHFLSSHNSSTQSRNHVSRRSYSIRKRVQRSKYHNNERQFSWTNKRNQTHSRSH